MGNLIMVLGKSGSGKSTSLRNFRPGEVGIYNVAGKRLPFRGGDALDPTKTVGYDGIRASMHRNTKRCYVIDDATYLMEFDNFARAKEVGYGKFTDMAVAFQVLLTTATATSDDTNVFFMMHPDYDDSGHEKPKTIGRMLDEKLCVEGLFTIVIDSATVAGEDGNPRHVFVTANDGTNLAKSPMGMFEPTMDNDLREVDRIIREYWGMAPLTDKTTTSTKETE